MEFPGKNKKAIGIIIILILIVSGLYLNYFRDRKDRLYTKIEYFMDTRVMIKVAKKPGVEKDVKDTFQEMKKWSKKLDRYDAVSTISKINETNKYVEVSPDIFSLVKMCYNYSELSNGAFDITISPLLDLWGFGKGDYRIPLEQELNRCLTLVNYKEIKFDENNNRIFLPKNMSLDLGGAAKGFIIDKGIKKLKRNGYKSIYINAGGNIRVVGKKITEDTPWKIGIKKPNDTNQIFEQYIVNVSTGSLATSGDYERYFTRDGKRYSHLIDPRTGHQSSELESVTIYAPTALQADILSTTVFIMGNKEGKDLIRNSPEIEGFLVNGDELWSSEGFKKLVY